MCYNKDAAISPARLVRGLGESGTCCCVFSEHIYAFAVGERGADAPEDEIIAPSSALQSGDASPHVVGPAFGNRLETVRVAPGVARVGQDYAQERNDAEDAQDDVHDERTGSHGKPRVGHLRADARPRLFQISKEPQQAPRLLLSDGNTTAATLPQFFNTTKTRQVPHLVPSHGDKEGQEEEEEDS